MVFQDISAHPATVSAVNQLNAVSLMDRFFAFILDYLVLSPFVSFSLFLAFKEELYFTKSHSYAAETIPLLVSLAAVYLILFCLLQAGFIYFYKATPGQYFLKIRIHFEEPHDFIFWRAFLRQISFWGSFLFFGVPLLSLLTHSRQLTFYDRLAAVKVYSLKRHPTWMAFENEQHYWKSLTATLMIFLTGMFAIFFWNKYQRLVEKSLTFHQLEKKQFFCSELEGVSFEDRLQTAIALNLVNRLSDSCLDKEADFLLWRSEAQDKSLAYFAKSLTESSLENEKKYLILACSGQKQSGLVDDQSFQIGCQIAQSFLTADFSKLYQHLKKGRTFSSHQFLTAVLKYELGIELGDQANLEAHLADLLQFTSHKAIKKYYLSENIKNRIQVVHSKTESETRGPASAEQGYDDIFQLIEEL